MTRFLVTACILFLSLETCPPAVAARTNVVVSTFKQRRLGAPGPELARLIPVFLSAQLAVEGASVVALQAAELAYLERLVDLAGLSYSTKSRSASTSPAALMVEGDYQLNTDRTFSTEWRSVDLTTDGIVRVAHTSSSDGLDFANLTRLSRAILIAGNIPRAPRPSLPAELAVAVAGFQVDERVAPEIAWMMEDYALAAIQNVPGVKAVERSKIRSIENELKLSLSGAVDPRRSVMVGRLTQADLVVYGAGAQTPAGYSYAVLVADVWSGLILRAAVGSCRAAIDLAPTAADAARRLLMDISGEPVQSDTSVNSGMESVYALYRAVNLYERSQLYPDGTELPAALEEVDRALLVNRRDAAARYLRGKILLKLKRFEDAIDEFVDIAKKYPKSIWAGESHKELGDRHFYRLGEIKEPRNTGMSMTAHYMTFAIDFPASFGAWESIIKLAQIYSGKEIPDTVFVPIYEKLIGAHPDHRNIVLYQWAGRYLYKDYSKNWDRVQPIFRRMDPKGWWHQFRVLRAADVGEANLTERVQNLYDARVAWAFDQASELEGKLLLTTCLDDDQTLHGRPVIDVRKELAAQLLENARRLVDLTVSAAELSNSEKATVLYNSTRKMVLATYSYSKRFEHLEAIAELGITILRQFPDESPYPMYVIHDLIECLYHAPKAPAASTILDALVTYVRPRPRLPGRTEILERLIKLNIRQKKWDHAETLLAAYEQAKDRDEKELAGFRDMVGKKGRYRGRWSPSPQGQGRDFQVRYARPAFNFHVQ